MLMLQDAPNPFIQPRPYDLHSAQIKKSDDLDNACAKSRVLEALLAQAVAMQIISTLAVSCGQNTSVLAVSSTALFGSDALSALENGRC
jgi:hypothetical protein